MYASGILTWAPVVVAPMRKLSELYKLQLKCSLVRIDHKETQNTVLDHSLWEEKAQFEFPFVPNMEECLV